MKTAIIFLLVLSLTALAFTCTESRLPPLRPPNAPPAPRLLLSGGTEPSCNLTSSVTSNVKVSFYGYPQNDPPNSYNTSLACDDRNHISGGTGAYDDPLTFATGNNAGGFALCEIVYLPFLQKYLIHEHICLNCTSVGTNIFVWMDMNTVTVFTLDGCEEFLGGQGNNEGVVREPPQNLLVDVDPFILKDGNCNTLIMHLSDPKVENCVLEGIQVAPASNSASAPASAPASSPASAPAVVASNPPEGSCSWPGHCQGASCGTDDDCADPFTCQNGSCA